MKRSNLVAVAGVVVLLLVGIAALVGFAAGHYTNRTKTVGAAAGPVTASGNVDPSVAAGAHVFVQFACSQCHGPNGRGGVSPDVPELKAAGKTLTVAQLSGIIDHGLGEAANPTKPYMPVWRGDLEAPGLRARRLHPLRAPERS
jgi:mono/diheme cytochrome c family protein